MRGLQDKVALVTGAGPGIGRACAAAFAEAGADVGVAARDRERLERLAAEIGQERGSSVVPFEVDTGDVASCSTLIERVIGHFGGIDILVNVATYGGGNAPVDTVDWESWRRAFEVNVIGTLELSRSAARSMAQRGGGSIVQIGTFATHSLPIGQSRYSATKQALVSASMTLARELGPKSVRVNVVTPGYTTGPNLDALFEAVSERTGESTPEVSTRLARTAALRRHVDPSDVAEAVLFLAGPGAKSITGVELPVTAGQH